MSERQKTFLRAFLQRRLLRWYDVHRRKLPWRENPSPHKAATPVSSPAGAARPDNSVRPALPGRSCSRERLTSRAYQAAAPFSLPASTAPLQRRAYRTWISEIMLQQTQVPTALPYYERFLRRFPDIQSLARVRESEVLRLWAGLGYYSRARNLHRAARIVASKFAGRFPDAYEDIRALPGIGRYTAGAILSIAFAKPYPLLDGNVARVLSRFFGVAGNVKSGAAHKTLWNLAAALVHASRPGDWNQALMELGALICVPQSPHCGQCPVAAHCHARKRGLQDELPEPPAKKKPVLLKWTCLRIEDDGKILLWKRDASERFLPGHWALPELRHLAAASKKPLGSPIAKIRHAITRHRITVDVHHARINGRTLPANASWVPRTRLRRYLVSSLWLKAAAAGPSRRNRS